MKTTVVAGVLLLICAAVSSAQSAPSLQAGSTGSPRADQRRVWGHGFFAPGIYLSNGPEKMVHMGGGVDWLFSRSTGLSLQVGLVGAGEGAAGSLSLNGSHVFRHARAGVRAVVPFVTAGSTNLLYDGPPIPMFNVGGGLNFWPAAGPGVRLESRYHVGAYDSFVDFRFGINFGR